MTKATWPRAKRAGVADPNPCDAIQPGELDLWAFDQYHASLAGSSLEALVVFGSLTGRDREVKMLQQVAFDGLAAAGAISPAASVPTSQPLERCAAGR